MKLEDLLTGQCHEYPEGSPGLTAEEISERLQLVPGWELTDGPLLRKTLRMQHFQDAVDFINEIAVVAEEQQHHPDLQLRSYRVLQIEFATHSIGALTDNDFIMAARVDALRP